MNKLELLILIEQTIKESLTERAVDFSMQRPFENEGPILLRTTTHDGLNKYYSIQIRDMKDLDYEKID